ncbi:MAG: EamA family transporter [Betaproteobacteria bacterium]|nr:EamA family transporter [Betaproteobacteria bacterium]MBI3055202.1 EamA family transporter [Betaproteobacteria bacterium]
MELTWIWIPISVFAALMQAVRTAAQKTLNQRMSTMGTTYVRSLFGMPTLIVFLAAAILYTGHGIPEYNPVFLLHTSIAALTQVLATALLIHMFRLKNFVVGTMLTKTDIIMTALIGTALFSEQLTQLGWVALVVVVCGTILMLAGKMGTAAFRESGETLSGLLAGRPTQVALMCALLFSLSYLFLREGTRDLGEQHHFLWRAGWTVVLATGLQTVCLGIWLAVKEPAVFKQMWPMRGIASFIGLTSALGSIGWYSAFALQNASYVRAVGQIEAVFTLAISWLYFREKVTALELVGIVVTVAGVLLFRLV